MNINDHKIILNVLLKLGLPQTLKLVAISLLLVLVVGILLGIIRSLKIAVIDQVLALYSQICRGIPIMIILLFMYATLPFDTPYWISVSALVFVEGGYIMEIIKGGLLSVDRGQWEAAKSLSLPVPTTLFKIIMPQVLLVTLPAVIGQLVLMVKGTAVASTIGYLELTKQGQMLLSSYSVPLVIYGYVLIIYFILCHTLTMISSKIEKNVIRNIIGDSYEK